MVQNGRKTICAIVCDDIKITLFELVCVAKEACYSLVCVRYASLFSQITLEVVNNVLVYVLASSSY